MRSLATWVLLGLLAACQSKSSGAPPRGKPVEVRDAQAATVDADFSKVSGEASYGALCAPCHGANLKGYAADHAPSLVNPTFLESATDDFLKASIIAGRPGTSMGAYGKRMGGPLDDASVARIVQFIRQQGPQTPPKVLPVIGVGDAVKGQKIYVESCKSCHGDQRMRGEAIHLANPSFLVAATDPFIKYAITNGRPETKMNAFGAVLNDQDITDVVAFIRSMGRGAAPVGTLPPPTGKEPMVINPKGAEPTWKPRDGKFIGVDEVAAALKKGQKMIIIDARPPSDWMRVHATGAISLPYHEPQRLKDIPKDVWTIAYCACPHHLSGIVVEELVKLGHKKALILDEGINVWHKKGYPVVAAEGVLPPVDEPTPTPQQPPHGSANHSH